MSSHVTQSEDFLFPFFAIKSHWCALGFSQPFVRYYPHLYYCDYVACLRRGMFLGHQETGFSYGLFRCENFSVVIPKREANAKRVIWERIAQETVNQTQKVSQKVDWLLLSFLSMGLSWEWKRRVSFYLVLFIFQLQTDSLTFYVFNESVEGDWSQWFKSQ